MRLTTIVPTLAAAMTLPATGRDGYQLQAVFGVALLLLLVTACTARTTADPVSSDPTFVGPAPPTTGAPVTTAATSTLPPTSTTAPLAAPSCLDGPLPGLVVGLGLGPTVLGTFTVDELRNPTSWRLDLNLFRARSGEVSLLDVLAELDDYDVTVGPHDNCNAPAVPPPDGLERAIRISVQPVLDRDSSCHAWYTVDFFVDSGEVAAITLDMWEP